MTALRDARSSKYLKEYGQVQEFCALFFFAIGAVSYVAALVSRFALLPAEVYGDFVTSIPAWVWAAALMAGSSVYYLGIQINGHAPVVSSSLRLAGAVSHMATLLFFVIGAAVTAGAEFFVISCSAFVCVFAVFAGMNLLDLIGALRKAR